VIGSLNEMYTHRKVIIVCKYKEKRINTWAKRIPKNNQFRYFGKWFIYFKSK